MTKMQRLLESEAAKRNCENEVSEERLDPIIVARESKDPTISLLCALFAYGNVTAIVRFLRSLDFSLIDAPEERIRSTLDSHYYRFQNADDITQLFITLRRLKQEATLEGLFMQGYVRERSVLEGIGTLLKRVEAINPYMSRGYRFLLSSAPDPARPGGHSPLKRWNMFLRWMVRNDRIDFGLWKEVEKSDLIIPLDTHTFRVAQNLKLLKRKQYDLKSALLLTERLKEFDPDDPVRYDFALYRIGQESKTFANR